MDKKKLHDDDLIRLALDSHDGIEYPSICNTCTDTECKKRNDRWVMCVNYQSSGGKTK